MWCFCLSLTIFERCCRVKETELQVSDDIRVLGIFLHAITSSSRSAIILHDRLNIELGLFIRKIIGIDDVFIRDVISATI